MTVRLSAAFVVAAVAVAALIVSGAPASASPRYSDWSSITAVSAVNTTDFEFASAFSKSGLRFYFQRGDAAVSAEDLWVIERDSDSAPWGSPTKLPATINSTSNERAAFESPDGHWLYFASDRPGGKGGFDLYAAWREHTHDSAAWQTATNVEALNTSGFDSGPTAFPDDAAGGLHMYLVSNPAGGQNAAVDIYESLQRPDGSWGPRTVVSALSSAVIEGRPSVRHDGLEIYFNSTRSTGQQDLWVSTRSSTLDPWTAPLSVSELNTSAPDVTPALSWDGKTIYFSSVRAGNVEIFAATREKATGKP